LKQAYTKPRKIHRATKLILDQILIILEEYENYKVTIRQVYYQLVTRLVFLNHRKNYLKTSTMIKDARMWGIIDWDAIEDRIRIIQIPPQWDNTYDLLDNTINVYRKDRHVGQKNYVEVWLEKDALSGVLLPITEKYHINFMVNRGYSSVSAMHNSMFRFQEAIDNGKDCTILYLGDHDPSGLDMIRDIHERLETFGVDVNVKQIGLTQEQVRKYNLPPNFTKTNDPRAKGYIEKHGSTSWELDALPPKVLNELLESNLKSLIDLDLYNEIVKQEELEKILLNKFLEELK